MKKNNLNKVFTGLLVCMLAVTAFAFQGCTNEDDSIFDYPEGAVLPKGDDAKPLKLKDFHGTLAFDDLEQAWIVRLKHVGPPIVYNYDRYVIYVSNMTDEYKAMAGEILFSGILKKLYSIPEAPGFCFSGGTNYFSIELTKIAPSDTSEE
ncbi:MAG: hypothetical protein IKB31_10500 [Bacteroidaceae bacterium]|nr:hypothetical protein [Bacteroidaceae bacterium]